MKNVEFWVFSLTNSKFMPLPSSVIPEPSWLSSVSFLGVGFHSIPFSFAAMVTFLSVCMSSTQKNTLLYSVQ